MTSSEGAATLAGPAVEFLAAARSGIDRLNARQAANLVTASAWMAEDVDKGIFKSRQVSVGLVVRFSQCGMK